MIPSRWISLALALMLAAGPGAATPRLTPTQTTSVPLFWHARTFGQTEVPYPADASYLNQPIGVAVDAADNIWIAEVYGQRALKFGPNGAFNFSIGVAGLRWRVTNDRPFDPTDLAFDATGNIWIAEVGAKRVAKYSPTGAYLAQIGVSEEPGIDNAHFGEPNSVAFDSHGNIYVSDWSNHRIQVFDSNRFYSTTIGVTGQSGTTADRLNNPGRITIDANDYLYVADVSNHRVQIFDPAHTVVATLGTAGVPGSGAAYLNSPRGAAVFGDRICVADGGNHRVQIFDRTTRLLVGTLGSGPGSGPGQFDTPTDVAVDSAGNLYVSDRPNFVVQKFNSAGQYLYTLGTSGVPYQTDGSHFNQPIDVAVDAAGNVAIIEGWGRGHRLVKPNSAGALQFTVGQAGIPGSEPARFADANGVAFDTEGRIYGAECATHRIQIFRGDGEWLAWWGSGPGTGNNQFNCPSGVAFDASGNIYVADASNHRVQVFNSSREYARTLGVAGMAGGDNGHFNWPNDVAVDASGNVYVADTFNHRVQKFNSSGAWVATLGTGACGYDNAHFCEPWGVAVDAAGNLYVAEKFNPRVQVFSSAGAYRTTIGGTHGSDPGQFRELYGVDVDAQGNVYAADLYNYRVEKFAPASLLFLPELSRRTP